MGRELNYLAFFLCVCVCVGSKYNNRLADEVDEWVFVLVEANDVPVSFVFLPDSIVFEYYGLFMGDGVRRWRGQRSGEEEGSWY